MMIRHWQTSAFQLFHKELEVTLWQKENFYSVKTERACVSDANTGVQSVVGWARDAVMLWPIIGEATGGGRW